MITFQIPTIVVGFILGFIFAFVFMGVLARIMNKDNED